MSGKNYYTIFYADDDVDDQEIFRDIVTEIDEKVYTFTRNNGDELMHLLKNPPPDPHLVFLDLNMPFKNGYDVLREVRQSEKLKHLPVVVFSTASDDESIGNARKLGATMYIVKPTSYKNLKGTLKHVLGIDWDTYRTSNNNFVYEF